MRATPATSRGHHRSGAAELVELDAFDEADGLDEADELAAGRATTLPVCSGR